MNLLVIGGSSGIGKALVEQLKTEHRMYASYHQHPMESTEQVTYFPFDALEGPLSMEHLPEVIDGLAYCPGSIQLKPFGRFSEADFLQDYRLQVTGAVKVLQAAFPRLKKSPQASVVLFSTVAVQTGMSFHSLVAASKGAVEGLVRSLAAEWAPSIRVNGIAPSLTDTPLASALLQTDEKREAAAQRHPLKKIGSAEDIARLAAFLLSPDSRWMTGQILALDGGMSTLK